MTDSKTTSTLQKLAELKQEFETGVAAKDFQAWGRDMLEIVQSLTTSGTGSVREQAFDAACEKLGLPSLAADDFLAKVDTLQRRAQCLDAIEDKFLTGAPSQIPKMVSPREVAWRHKPSGTIQTFPLEERQLTVSYQFEALGVIENVSPKHSGPEAAEDDKVERLVSREVGPAPYTVQFGLALNRIVAETLAARRIPGNATLPADSTVVSWNDAVMKVYLSSWNSQKTQGIPSHWLDHMKESLVCATEPKTVVPVEVSLVGASKDNTPATEPSLSKLAAALKADLTEMRNVTQRYFSSPVAGKTVREASGVILELETRATELLMKLR